MMNIKSQKKIETMFKKLKVPEQVLKLLIEGLQHLHQPFHPLATKLMLMLLVKGHRRSENDLKLIMKINIWQMHCQDLLHYMIIMNGHG